MRNRANEGAEAHFLEVGLQVREFEEMTDKALGSGGTLLQMLTDKRLELGISGPASQEIIASVVGSLTTMADARGQCCVGHMGLRDLRDRYRENPRAEGDCCPPKTGELVQARLHAVE